MATFITSAIGSLTAGVAASLAVERFITGRIAILGSFVGLQPSFNDGIAFGLNLPFQPFLILLALIVVTIMGVHGSQTRLSATGFGLIVGGGWANIVDRMIDGTVTDVFQVGTFPIFNIADSCITIGVGLLLLEMLLRKGGEGRKGIENRR